jgi:hypothetical protein
MDQYKADRAALGTEHHVIARLAAGYGRDRQAGQFMVFREFG